MSDKSSSPHYNKKSAKTKGLSIWANLGIIFAIIIIIILIVVVPIVVTFNKQNTNVCISGNGNFKKHVVVSDSDICSEIGCITLSKGGNIIDSVIATAFCTGVVNMHSTGLGGGGFMVYHNKEKNTQTFVDFRESAPMNVNEEMYNNGLIEKSFGTGSVAVPSFVPGLYYIWEKYGKLEWKKLVEPAQNLLEEGFKFSSSTAETITNSVDRLKDFPEIKSVLRNPETGSYYQKDEIYRDPLLAETLRIIGNDPNEFISGDFGKMFFEDLCKNQSKSRCFLRNEDRFLYKIKETEPISREVFGKMHYTANLPSSAAISGFLMKVLEFSKIESFDKNNEIDYSNFLHRYIEAMKFGYAFRQYWGDPTNIEDPEIFQQSLEYVTNDILAEYIARYMIDDRSANLDTQYYDIINRTTSQPVDSGTSHISIIDANGNGVAMTTTINGGFGSFIRSPSTGILYNNEMDDFSARNDVNIFGFKESINNFVRRGKKPLSSMSPTVMVDKETKKAIVVSGASGGSRIISATSQVVLNYLLGNMDINEAMNEPRVHHQFDPNEVRAETNRPLNQIVHDLLEAKNHIFTNSTSFASVQSAVNEEGILYGSADSRKNGIPYGQ